MSTPSWSIDPELRALLVCPLTRCELIDVERGLYSPQADRVFPVVDGVPYMLRDLSLEPEPQEREQAAAVQD